MMLTQDQFHSVDCLDDNTLFDEVKYRGYDIVNKHNLQDIFWEYSRGNVKETLILLERVFPELKGISKKVN